MYIKIQNPEKSIKILKKKLPLQVKFLFYRR
jgi:hypothetical protein